MVGEEEKKTTIYISLIHAVQEVIAPEARGCSEWNNGGITVVINTSGWSVSSRFESQAPRDAVI